MCGLDLEFVQLPPAIVPKDVAGAGLQGFPNDPGGVHEAYTLNPSF